MITRIAPEGLHPTPGYAHVAPVDAGRLAFFAGQMPVDDSGMTAALSPRGADAR